MSRLGLTLLTLVLVACGSGRSTEPPAGPLKPRPEIPPPQQPIIPPDNIDTTPPKVIAFHQEGLQQIVVEFSEPIQSIDKLTHDIGFESLTWDASRKILTARFDVERFKEGITPSLRLIRFLDDANLQNLEEVVISIDNAAPVIDAIKVIDAHTLLLTFNEDIKLSGRSTFVIDEKFDGELATERPDARQAKVEFPDIDLTQSDSHQLTVNRLADAYGNFAAARRRGFSLNADNEAPTLASIKQIPTLRFRYTYFGFELEFSEYALDSRDVSGKLPVLQDILESNQTITINGKKISLRHGLWMPRDDHRGGTLYLDRDEVYPAFLNGQQNTIGLYLTDPLGNRNVALGSLVIDSKAPDFVRTSAEGRQCEMSGLQSFRCQITDPDVENAELSPMNDWPREDYSVSVSKDLVDGKEQYWLSFQFKKVVPEKSISGILLVDAFRNTNLDAELNWVFFKPSTLEPELKKVVAFSDRVLELEFSVDVGSIDSIQVDGITKAFDMTFVDKERTPSQPANVIVHFATPIEDGIHTLELVGMTRARNKVVQVKSIVLKDIDNRIPTILQTSITQKPDLQGSADLRFELTRPVSLKSLQAFASRSDDVGRNRHALSDVIFTEEGKTSRDTYAIRLHKKSADGLEPQSTSQGISLQIQGQPATETVYIRWSTRDAQFYMINHARPDGFEVLTSEDLDVDNLTLEIVNGLDVIHVERAWISSYYDKSRDDSGFKVTLPADIRLKKSSYTYQLRVTRARTLPFGIELRKPFETYLTIN